MAVINFFVIGKAYDRGLDFGSILSHTITLVLFFLLCSSMAMIAAYISELHAKMATTIVQNQRLLNGMHEGLLIISNSNSEEAQPTAIDQVKI